ncbi:unnamed protein product [Paramecium sonneborni]|uniref:Uncharacterized protein n=1 Tax=Paramecium sonneborni TaxID=65129 RepID=A0A8S1MJ81_9CILI|nr:unnamed protein product [Paramecium sonneborni]
MKFIEKFDFSNQFLIIWCKNQIVQQHNNQQIILQSYCLYCLYTQQKHQNIMLQLQLMLYVSEIKQFDIILNLSDAYKMDLKNYHSKIHSICSNPTELSNNMTIQTFIKFLDFKENKVYSLYVLDFFLLIYDYLDSEQLLQIISSQFLFSYLLNQQGTKFKEDYIFQSTFVFQLDQLIFQRFQNILKAFLCGLLNQQFKKGQIQFLMVALNNKKVLPQETEFMLQIYSYLWTIKRKFSFQQILFIYYTEFQLNRNLKIQRTIQNIKFRYGNI